LFPVSLEEVGDVFEAVDVLVAGEVAGVFLEGKVGSKVVVEEDGEGVDGGGGGGVKVRFIGSVVAVEDGHALFDAGWIVGWFPVERVAKS